MTSSFENWKDDRMRLFTALLNLFCDVYFIRIFQKLRQDFSIPYCFRKGTKRLILALSWDFV